MNCATWTRLLQGYCSLFRIEKRGRRRFRQPTPGQPTVRETLGLGVLSLYWHLQQQITLRCTMASMGLLKSCCFFALLFLFKSNFISGARTGAYNWQKTNITAAADGPLAQTEYGPVRGVYITEEREVRAFLGIPYAAPPVGDLRWQPPQKLEAWNGEYQATQQPVGCPQGCGDPYSCPPGVSR